MKAKKISLTSDALHELLRYEPDDGKLFWKVRKAKNTHIGDEAGSSHSGGYIAVKINGGVYLAHRIIWLMAHGEIRDDLEIDHINGVKDDNRIENLRLVTHLENQWNITNAKGYYWNTRERKWKARISVGESSVHLGTFSEEHDARNAYLKAKKKYHKIEEHGKRKAE